METPTSRVAIVALPAGAAAVDALLAGRAGGQVEPVSAAVVAGPDASAVGEAMTRLRAAGLAAAGWVGDPSDPAVAEMAAELFPGCEIVDPDG